MRLKEGVSIEGLKAEMIPAIIAISHIWYKHGREAVMTAGTKEFDNRGKRIHMEDSLHPDGFAIDIRTRYFSKQILIKVEAETKQALILLGYDVIFHKTHCHVEWDPK